MARGGFALTGRIKHLSAERRSGSIETQASLKYSFDWSSVLMHDLAFLIVGQLVTFDPKGKEAVNISVERRDHPAPVEGKKHEFTFRYLGFDQANSIRTHRFERTSYTESKVFLVHTDTTMFARLRIGIQEGPTLCRQLLSEGPNEEPPGERSLTEQHLLDFLASKPAHPRRTPPKRPVRPVS
jgi:hypothetical protein